LVTGLPDLFTGLEDLQTGVPGFAVSLLKGFDEVLRMGAP
jgi:hypothetical protein